MWEVILKLLLSHDSHKPTSEFQNDLQRLLTYIGIQKYKKMSVC